MDTDDAGGIYRATSLKILQETGNSIPYFDGRSLRHGAAQEPRVNLGDRWDLNVSVEDVTKSIGIPESMYIPISTSYKNNPFVLRFIVFNETYLIPPSFYKDLLKGVTNKSLNVLLQSPPIRTNITFPAEAVSEIEIGNWKKGNHRY